MRLCKFLSFLLLIACAHTAPKDLRIVELLPGHTRSQHETRSKGAIIASQGKASSFAGLQMLNEGGNIIDAAVAVSFAISVERPQSTGIGGGGFLIFYENQKHLAHVFDFREMAPAKSHARMFLKSDGTPDVNKSIYGPHAVGTPGLVRGLWEIHKAFGKLPWAKTVAPAIELARKGFAVYPHLAMAINEEQEELKKNADAKKLFFQPDGKPLPVGALLKQEDLAKTLEVIAQKGEKGFYEGKIAQSIVNTVKKRGGMMTLADLKDYQVKKREPVTGDYKGYKIISMPPPSSGGTHVVQIMNLIEKQDLGQYGPQHPETIHRLATAEQIAFADRAKYMGDPDFAQIPVKEMTAKSYAAKMQHHFLDGKAVKSSVLPLPELPKESTETTHFTLADADQNIVVSTQTINGWFGSAMVAQGTGIVLNNEMDDFAQAVGASNLYGAIGGDKNLVAPMKRPLSSMSPTIILKDNKPFMALGTPSGTRIITCVTQTALNVLEFKLPLYEAVAATRIHHQWKPEEIWVEKPFLPETTIADLKERGHKVAENTIGCQIQAIKREGNEWVGVSDPRGEGLAIGSNQ